MISTSPISSVLQAFTRTQNNNMSVSSTSWNSDVLI